MATYKGINGFAVQSVASDPSPLDEGQVWYNNATYAFKLAAVTTAGTFASGGNLNNGGVIGAVAGTQTATVAFGRIVFTPATPSNVTQNYTELYNGTSWTSNPTGLNTARVSNGGAGTQTAALAFLGYQQPPDSFTNVSESWNGSSWTNTPSANTARGQAAGFGTNTAAVAAGGYFTSLLGTTELWNGSSWTSNPTGLNTARYVLGGVGIQTAGLAFGGSAGPNFDPTGATELWNGSVWTNSPNSMNTARYGLAGFGTQTAAVAASGETNTTATEIWNGTSWSTNPTGVSTGRYSSKGSGTQASGLVSGGSVNPTPVPTAFTGTEEWTGPGVPQTKTITTS